MEAQAGPGLDGQHTTDSIKVRELHCHESIHATSHNVMSLGSSEKRLKHGYFTTINAVNAILPAATSSSSGVVKVGASLSINDEILNVNSTLPITNLNALTDTLNIGSNTGTTTINLATNTTTQTINIGTGSGSVKTINIGNGLTQTDLDTINIIGNLNVSGTTTTINSNDIDIKDKVVTLNKDGPLNSGFGVGIEVYEQNNFNQGYIKTSTDRTKWNCKPPNGGSFDILPCYPSINSGTFYSNSSHISGYIQWAASGDNVGMSLGTIFNGPANSVVSPNNPGTYLITLNSRVYGINNQYSMSSTANLRFQQNGVVISTKSSQSFMNTWTHVSITSIQTITSPGSTTGFTFSGVDPQYYYYNLNMSDNYMTVIRLY